MGFEAAALKDPGLTASQEVLKIVNVLDKIQSVLKVIMQITRNILSFSN